MNKKTKSRKALKPSQRESITEFSSHFGSGFSYEEKAKVKKAIRIIIIALCIAFLVTVGYFLTDVLIRFTEVPAQAHISPEAALQWITYHTTQG